MQPLALLGPLDAVDPFVKEILLVLAVANVVTRGVAHVRHKRQADDGADAMSRHMGHELTNVLLIVGSFYLVLVEFHAGFIMSMLVLGLVVTDLFEFEARKVEARTDRTIEMPKGALLASFLVVSYAAFQALWFLFEGPWQQVVS